MPAILMKPFELLKLLLTVQYRRKPMGSEWAIQLLLLLLVLTKETIAQCVGSGNNGDGIATSMITDITKSMEVAKCNLLASEMWPEDRASEKYSVESLEDLSYDYIIVGAGSAGAIIASRLSEEPNVTVLLLEAGDEPPLESEIFSLSATLHADTRYMWLDESVANGISCLGMTGGKCRWPHGRMMGGTGGINGNIFLPGSIEDFDKDWRLPGWRWKNIEPIYRRMLKDRMLIAPFDMLPEHERLAKLVYDAVAELGVQRVKQPLIDGVTGGYTHLVPTTVAHGRRASSGRQYLAMAGMRERSNLHVMRGALAEQLVLRKGHPIQAEGVRYRLEQRNVTLTAYTRREIIVSAGAINSPKLLLQSGIGPRGPRLRLPVGEQLQDHGMLPLFLEFTANCSVNSSNQTQGNVAAIVDYLLRGQSGPLGSGFSLMGFLNSVNPSLSSEPGIRHDLHVVAHTLLSRASSGSLGYLGLNEALVAAQKKSLQFTDQLQVMGSLLRPRSRGTLRLRRNPQDPPMIDYRLGSHPEDLNVLLRFVRFIERLTKTEAFNRCGLKLWQPQLTSCGNVAISSSGSSSNDSTDDYWQCYVRNLFISSWHPVGTCRMGITQDPRTVVDPRLRVKGVRGLRVIDASIMPEISTGNTNGQTMMIAEMGAQMIRDDLHSTASSSTSTTTTTSTDGSPNLLQNIFTIREEDRALWRNQLKHHQ